MPSGLASMPSGLASMPSGLALRQSMRAEFVAVL